MFFTFFDDFNFNELSLSQFLQKFINILVYYCLYSTYISIIINALFKTIKVNEKYNINKKCSLKSLKSLIMFILTGFFDFCLFFFVLSHYFFQFFLIFKKFQFTHGLKNFFAIFLFNSLMI